MFCRPQFGIEPAMLVVYVHGQEQGKADEDTEQPNAEQGCQRGPAPQVRVVDGKCHGLEKREACFMLNAI